VKDHFLAEFMDLRRAIGKDLWYLAAALAFYSARTMALITAPAGFLTDFASIPRFFHRLIPKNGTYDAAAVLHDFLYAIGLYTKEICDLIFLDALILLCGPRPVFTGSKWSKAYAAHLLAVSKWKAEIARAKAMYQAVKWFGFSAWNAHRKNQRPEDKLPSGHNPNETRIA
jgi:hypothetical protein